jgi:hypothetical protein
MCAVQPASVRLSAIFKGGLADTARLFPGGKKAISQRLTLRSTDPQLIALAALPLSNDSARRSRT